MTETLRATLPVPVPKKSSKEWRKCGDRLRLVPNRRAMASEKRIAAQVAALRPRKIESADVEVEFVYHAISDSIDVVVREGSPKPTKGRNGRGRDLDNMVATLLDALRLGGAYSDDRQVARLVVERWLD